MQDFFPASKVLHALHGSDDWQKRRQAALKEEWYFETGWLFLGDREWMTWQEDQCEIY